MKARITKRVVDTLQPGERVYDTEIRGFICRRLASGVAIYSYRYYVAGGERWVSIGQHGEITADQARALAKKRAGERADGRDPVAERETARAVESNTVDAVLGGFMPAVSGAATRSNAFSSV